MSRDCITAKKENCEKRERESTRKKPPVLSGCWGSASERLREREMAMPWGTGGGGPVAVLGGKDWVAKRALALWTGPMKKGLGEEIRVRKGGGEGKIPVLLGGEILRA